MRLLQFFLSVGLLIAVMPFEPAKAEEKAKAPAVEQKSKSKPAATQSPWRSIKANPNNKTSKAKVEVKAEPPKGATKPLSDFEVGKYQYCGDDRDCVLSYNGCCDCANGGQDVALNKERLEAFRARFDCLNVNCGEKLGNPPCASGVVSCINHKCRYLSEPPVEEEF